MPNADPYSASFAIPKGLHVDALFFDGDLLTISGCLRGSEAHCPVCGERSRRIHGLYTRTLADLPWSGTPVRLRVRVRKFFCDEPACERRIFAERLPDVARPFARGTDRRRDALGWIAFALGGEAGARLARELGLLASPDTLLNRIRGALRAEAEDVRVLGVDDFGFKRGNASDTIMVDLERHQIVDLFRRPLLRDLGADRGGRREGQRLPERPPPSLRVGAAQVPPARQKARGGRDADDTGGGRVKAYRT